MIAIVSCSKYFKDEDKNNTQTSLPAPAAKEVFAKHDAKACPTNLVGTYEKIDEEKNYLTIYLQPDGTLVAISEINGIQLGVSVMAADGVRWHVFSSGKDDYRISYCENFNIVSFGQLQGKPFMDTLYATPEGIELASSVSNGPGAIQHFAKLKKPY